MKIKLDKGAYPLERAHPTDAGLDIRTPVAFDLYPGHSITINTGVHIELPPMTCGLLVSKSGLNVKDGITSTGLIDEGYTGEIIVKLYNNDPITAPYGRHFHRGAKISQLVVIPCAYPEVEIVDEIAGGPRGDDGFGSTGV